MKVYELTPPTKSGSPYWGMATTKTGRRYKFVATPDGETFSVCREGSVSSDGRTFWETVKAPRALRDAVRKAVAA